MKKEQEKKIPKIKRTGGVSVNKSNAKLKYLPRMEHFPVRHSCHLLRANKNYKSKQTSKNHVPKKFMASCVASALVFECVQWTC